MSGPIEQIIPVSVKSMVPYFVKDTLRKLKPRTKLQKDLELFVLDGTRFTPPLADFPSIVMLDTTSRCNLTCTHCPNSAMSKEADFLGDMSNELIYKILDEIAAEAPGTLTRLFDSGEPLLRKDLHEHVRYAKRRGIQIVSITTNGTMLVEKRRKELIEAGMDHIEVSLDAATAETYLKIRQSPLYDRVVKNTLSYIKESKAYNAETRLTVSFVLQTDNRHEEEAFKKFWDGKADKVYIREFHTHNNLVDDHGLFKNHGNPDRHPCPFLWDRLIIGHNGDVRFCEFDWKGDHAIGNIRSQTVKEIWHGEAYRNLRESHVKGAFCHDFCRGCTDWRQVNWDGNRRR